MSSITVAHNLNSNEYLTYVGLSPLMTVMSAHCIDNGKLSWLTYRQHTMSETDIAKDMPITVGKHSVCCGDWCCKTES